MPSKKKKYNARFPAGRIKKIMQSDEEIGKVAQAVPVIISRTLELFVESLLTKTLKITNTRNAKTLSPTHLKQCIMAEQRFDFLRELVKNLPDISLADEAAANYDDVESSPEQDSFSDPAMDTHQQQATTSISHTNGQMDESKLRRTRSIQQQFELQQQNQQQHEILERIQKSMHQHKLLRTESTPNADTNCSAPKRARQTATTTTTTATTSTIAGKCKQTDPIVHVQIDYGNIPWKLKNDKSVPLSAPAQIVQPVFDFSQMGSNQTPISISIDLSSINKNNSTMTPTATTTTSAINSQAAKPKATITTTTSPPPIRTSPLEKSNMLLELDEDYDDI